MTTTQNQTCPSTDKPPPPPPPPPPLPPSLPVQRPLSESDLSKSVRAPNKKMRPFPWQEIRLTEGGLSKGTLWSKWKTVDDLPKINYTELENLFGVEETTTLKLNACTEQSTDSQNGLPRQKMAIIETSLKIMGYTDLQLIELIEKGDGGLELAHYKSIREFLPTKDEIKYLQRPTDHPHRVEEFLKLLINIPECEQWLDALIYREEVNNIPDIPAIDLELKEIFEFLMENTNFHDFLGFVLHVGLFLNKGKKDLANADGFKLLSLEKLINTKSVDERTDLLEFIVHEIERSYPNILTFAYEETLHKAKRCMVSQAVEEYEKTEKKVKSFISKLKIPKCQIRRDRLETVVKEITSKIETTTAAVQAIRKTAENIADFLHEDHLPLSRLDKILSCLSELGENITNIKEKTALNTCTNAFNSTQLRATLRSTQRRSESEPVNTADDSELSRHLERRRSKINDG